MKRNEIKKSLQKSGAKICIALVKKLSKGVIGKDELAESLGVKSVADSKAKRNSVKKSSAKGKRPVSKATPQKRDGRSHRVDMFTPDGKYITTYNSMTEAAKKHSVSTNAIWLCCIGKTKTSAGYKWKYSDTLSR